MGRNFANGKALKEKVQSVKESQKLPHAVRTPSNAMVDKNLCLPVVQNLIHAVTQENFYPMAEMIKRNKEKEVVVC